MRKRDSGKGAARALLLCALGLAAGSSWASVATAEVVGLDELERLAIEQRPELAAAAARTRAARADIDHSLSAYFPALGLGAEGVVGPGRSLFEVFEASNEPLPPEELNRVLVQGSVPIREPEAWRPSFTSQVGLELRANILDFGRTGSSVDQSRAAARASEAAEEAAREAITGAVRGAYLQWLAQTELLAIAEQAATEGASRSQRVQALIAEGARPKAELSAARADELLSALELERARGELRAARLAVEQAVGKKLSASAEPDRALLVGPRDTQATAPKATVESPTLRALAAQRRAAAAQAEFLDGADRPLLSGTAATAVRTIDERIFPAYSVGIKFAWPLWDGGASEAASSAARAQAEALDQEIAAERGKQRDEQARAQLARDNAQTRLAAAEALLAVARTRADEAQEAYDLGAIDIAALADARALLRRAKTEVLHEQLARAEADLVLRSPR